MVKGEREKRSLMLRLEATPGLSLYDRLCIAFDSGYTKGFQAGAKLHPERLPWNGSDPLYDDLGRQIREVTEEELQWTH